MRFEQLAHALPKMHVNYRSVAAEAEQMRAYEDAWKSEDWDCNATQGSADDVGYFFWFPPR